MCEPQPPGDNVKYKWTPESTALLVSVWSDRQVQKQLEYAPRPQLIWENVAHYMRKKGYNVAAKHCRSRMKHVLVCYREAKYAGSRSGVEQYYEMIDRVLKNKRQEHINVNGIDTVDATVNVRSPVKDMKTNKNLRLRVQEPVPSFYRTDALSPTWTVGRENEHPDSPESNETVIAKPYRVFSPTRDVAINTSEHVQIGNRIMQTNSYGIEDPIRENYRQNLLVHPYPYGDIPYQNTVQNVQNQIIQENMQQYHNIQQNRGWNQIPQQNGPINNHGFQQNVQNSNQYLPNGAMQANIVPIQNTNTENITRQQNQLHNILVDNRALPQEPRKSVFKQNLAATYKQYKDAIPRLVCIADPNCSPDVSQNLNDAFCQSKSESKTHNLNETYNQPNHLENLILTRNADATVVTNNATCNDDSMLLEFLLDSPTLSENHVKSKDSAVNTDNVPNAPFRKKKAQKLEQLVISAINSQNEVVNKILAAQNDMVARFLDVDRNRQNKLEDRLNVLLNVVHNSLGNNIESERGSSTPPPLDPAIISLAPPPKPGMIPPKLDLVPPKPCRVRCTMPSSNIELINQNPISTRPGIVSPITSPTKTIGTIWSRLGPVSQSPFVKAQQRLGLQTVFNSDIRTQSSAERRIAKEFGKLNIDTPTLIYETAKLLEMEKHLEEKIENARLEMNMGQILTTRKRLFTQREPTPIIILTAAFLDAECDAYDQDPPYYGTWNSRKEKLKYPQRDKLLAGQGESYERLRQLNAQLDCLAYEPCDASTPAKLRNRPSNSNNSDDAYAGIPKQTIQQLARLVMNSARWRDASKQNQQHNVIRPAASNQDEPDIEYNATFTAPKANAPPPPPPPPPPQVFREQQVGFVKNGAISNIIQNAPARTNGNGPIDGRLLGNDLCTQPKFPMGFNTAMLTANERKPIAPRRSLKFGDNPINDRKNSVRFMDDALAELQRMYIERQGVMEGTAEILPYITSNNNATNIYNQNMIEQYVNSLKSKKFNRNYREKDTDSDDDDEFLDTTANMHPNFFLSKDSLTSSGTTSTGTAHSLKLGKSAANCIIS